MRLEPIDPTDPRDVLRGLRGAVLGAGPAIALTGPGGRGRGYALAGGGDPAGGGAPAGGGDLAGWGDLAGGGATGGMPSEVPSGTAVVVTTSGSTGHPKAVAISRSALTSSALATEERLGGGAWLLALPAGYIAGVQVLVRSLVAGREPAILAGSFSAQAFAAAAGTMASSVGGARVPTYTSLVPAQLQTLLDAEAAGLRTRLASFEAVLVGGQALAPALAERAAEAGVRIVRTYGSSETSGGCVYDGVPLRDVGVRVVDGEVQVSGPMLADGYLGDPARTDEVFVRDGDGIRWYRTGDAGAFDGVLRITGRLDNVIISGGVNISLDRVERVVRSLPGLEHAVVVPVPDERWGEASVVAVAADPTRAAIAALRVEVREAVAAELGAPARPRGILALPKIPLLSSGKPDRAALRALAEQAAQQAAQTPGAGRQGEGE